MSQLPYHKPSYRAEIDGLRAFAVLSVVVFHAFPSWLEGGYIGVDVFFVISGFLISSHIFQSLSAGQFSFIDFFGRRVRRIFPALILVSASCVSFGWVSLLPHEFAQLGKHVASGAVFITNFVLVDEIGYFDTAATSKPMLHLWSLAVEEQFYIVWPLLLWLAWKRNVSLLTITFSVAAFSFCLNLTFVKSHPTEVFYWPFSRFWELLSGSALAWFLLNKATTLSKLKLSFDAFIFRIIQMKGGDTNVSMTANLMALFGMLLLVYGATRIDESLAYPSTWALIPVFGTTLVIFGGSQAWLNRVVLMNPIAIWFGLISYPLYLWHWPILSFLQIIEGDLPHRDVRLGAIFVSVLLAWMTYYFIERTIRNGGNKAFKSIALIVMIAFIGITGFFVQNVGGETRYNQKLKYISEAKNDWAYPNGLIDRNGFLSTSTKDPSVLFFGDSHIEQYGPRIVRQYTRGEIVEAAFITRGGCLLVQNDARVGYEICNELYEKMDDVLAAFPIKTIILSFCFNCYFIPTAKGNEVEFVFRYNNETYDLSSKTGLIYAKRSFYDFVKKLSKKYDVIVLLDNPKDDRFHPANMLDKDKDKKRKLPLTAAINSTPFLQSKEQIQLLNEIDAALGQFATVVRQDHIVCPDGICHPIDEDGWPIYKDADHMRPYFIEEHMDVLDPYLRLSKN